MRSERGGILRGVEFPLEQAVEQPKPSSGPLASATSQPHVLWSTTSVLTAAILVYAVGAGITAAAGTRLALQLIIIAGFGYGIHCKFRLSQGPAELLQLVAASPGVLVLGNLRACCPP